MTPIERPAILPEERQTALKFRSLKCRKPVRAADFGIHEFDIRRGDDSETFGDARIARRSAARDDELPAHPNDLRAVGIEVDLAVERGEARRVAKVRRDADANDRNRSRAGASVVTVSPPENR